MREQLQQLALAVVDLAMAGFPRQVPDAQALQACKLIAHRGEHADCQFKENTLAAFHEANRRGVWGVEADVRFTADGVPVIHHDADTRRVFGHNLCVHEVTFNELRKALPQLPSLQELVMELGGLTHLMLEIKAQPAIKNPRRQKALLKELLSTLTPGRNFHCLALDPLLFERVDFIDRRYCLPISETNAGQLSQVALAEGYGGVMGHYLLLGDAIKARHDAAGQCIGTGFINSRNCLFRELGRGVQWLFSNHAAKLQGLVEQALIRQAP